MSYRDSQFGAVSIYNSQNVKITNCSFFNNTSNGSYVKRPFQAASGGLSISYINGTYSSVNISVSGCNFTKNSATLPDTIQRDIQRLSFQSGRGGGVAIFINSFTPVNCVVSNSVFVNNKADDFGGGLICNIITVFSHQIYKYGNLLFVNNSAKISGAFLHGYLFSRSSEAFLGALITNCTFVENNAGIGGVANIYYYDGLVNNSVTFSNCVFSHNSATEYAGAVDVVSFDFFADKSRYSPVSFIDW